MTFCMIECSFDLITLIHSLENSFEYAITVNAENDDVISDCIVDTGEGASVDIDDDGDGSVVNDNDFFDDCVVDNDCVDDDDEDDDDDDDSFVDNDLLCILIFFLLFLSLKTIDNDTITITTILL